MKDWLLLKWKAKNIEEQTAMLLDNTPVASTTPRHRFYSPTSPKRNATKRNKFFFSVADDVDSPSFEEEDEQKLHHSSPLYFKTPSFVRRVFLGFLSCFFLLLLFFVLFAGVTVFYVVFYKGKGRRSAKDEVQKAMKRTVSAVTTRAQWTKAAWYYTTVKKHSKINNHDEVDEYGFPLFSSLCRDENHEWPLLQSKTKNWLCEAMEKKLGEELRVYAFEKPNKLRMRYKTLRQLPSFNRGYDVEGYLVEQFSRGPFSVTKKDWRDATAFLLPAQPYMDRVSAFPFSDGRRSIERGIEDITDYAMKKEPEAWELASKTCRSFAITTHDYGVTFAKNIVLPEGRMVDKTTFLASNAELEVKDDGEFYPFSRSKDVSVIPSLSFFLPKETMRRKALTDDGNGRKIRLMFRGNIRGRLRKKLFSYLIVRADKRDSIETTGLTSPTSYIKLMETSKYCLHVRGTRVQSPRLIELMLFGCVPVILANAYELPLSWFLDWSKFSLIVREEDYRDVYAVVDKANWTALHSNLAKVAPFFTYHKKPILGDAFYATALGLRERLRHRPEEDSSCHAL